MDKPILFKDDWSPRFKLPFVAGQQIAETARTYIGVPYRLNGRFRESGMDCLGVTCGVAATFGLRLNFLDYTPASGAQPSLEQIVSYLKAHGFAEIQSCLLGNGFEQIQYPEVGCLNVGTIDGSLWTGCSISNGYGT